MESGTRYVIFSAVFPVMVNTMTGVKNVPLDLTEVGASFCANDFGVPTLERTSPAVSRHASARPRAGGPGSSAKRARRGA